MGVKSYSAAGCAASLMGALTMMLMYVGMAREYAFFGYEGDQLKAASTCARTAAIFLGLAGLLLVSYGYGVYKEKSAGDYVALSK
mmetsp:Transcript_1301/g.3587  ORF Transcript_1301/g.3587 Transcript_1301/m.3587 type:complete len:85 (-) Transcript_1301:934-1188(-)